MSESRITRIVRIGFDEVVSKVRESGEGRKGGRKEDWKGMGVGFVSEKNGRENRIPIAVAIRSFDPLRGIVWSAERSFWDHYGTGISIALLIQSLDLSACLKDLYHSHYLFLKERLVGRGSLSRSLFAPLIPPYNSSGSKELILYGSVYLGGFAVAGVWQDSGDGRMGRVVDCLNHGLNGLRRFHGLGLLE